jgi:hypothetical protein
VASSFLQGEGTPKNPYRLRASTTEACIVKYSHTYLQALLALGCLPPFAVLVSLIGVKDIPYSFAMGHSIWGDDAGTLDRDQFHFTEAIVDDAPPDPQTYAQILRPLLDETANAAERPRTPSFDDNVIFRLKVT